MDEFGDPPSPSNDVTDKEEQPELARDGGDVDVDIAGARFYQRPDVP